MSLSGSCIIKIDGKEHAPETVSFVFSDEHVELLRGFLSEAKRLQTSVRTNKGFPTSLRFSAENGQLMKVNNIEPTDDQRAILLHRLRPFLLQDEPYQFGKIRNVVARGTSSSPFMQSYLKRAKDLFAGTAMQEQIKVSIGDAILNSEAALTAWLNVDEYHRDETKMISFLKGKQLPSDDITRPIFVMLLRYKVDAVLALGNVVHRILSSSGELGTSDV